MNGYRCNRCPICNPKVFEYYFGHLPGANVKRRRTHDEVVLEKKRKSEIVTKRREFYKQRRMK